MGESEDLSLSFDPMDSSTKGHYSPGTVYEEYGRSYADLGMTDKAMGYLEQAEESLPQTKFWQLLIATSKAVAHEVAFFPLQAIAQLPMHPSTRLRIQLLCQR